MNPNIAEDKDSREEVEALDAVHTPESEQCIENVGDARYNEWGNLEPNQGLIDDIMLDDGWMSLETAKIRIEHTMQELSDRTQLEEDMKDAEDAWREVFGEN